MRAQAHAPAGRRCALEELVVLAHGLFGAGPLGGRGLPRQVGTLGAFHLRPAGEAVGGAAAFARAVLPGLALDVCAGGAAAFLLLPPKLGKANPILGSTAVRAKCPLRYAICGCGTAVNHAAHVCSSSAAESDLKASIEVRMRFCAHVRSTLTH